MLEVSLVTDPDLSITIIWEPRTSQTKLKNVRYNTTRTLINCSHNWLISTSEYTSTQNTGLWVITVYIGMAQCWQHISCPEWLCIKDPIKHAQLFRQSCHRGLQDSCDKFSHILQDCFIGAGANPVSVKDFVQNMGNINCYSTTTKGELWKSFVGCIILYMDELNTIDSTPYIM